MIALPLLALLVHIAAIAALAPGVEITPDALPWIVGAQFPLMGMTTAVFGVARDREDDGLAGWALAAFGLGVTVPVLLLLVRYDISIGPADPYGAPDSASSTMIALWFAGFCAVAAVGHTMFIARPIIHMVGAIFGPLRRRSFVPALAVSVSLAAGLGAAVALLLDSATVAGAMASLRQQTESNPGLVIIAGMGVAVLLNVTKRATVPRKRR